MRNILTIALSLILSGTLIACGAKQKNILETGASQVNLRSMQSRVFDTTDRERLLKTIIATMQDLSFLIDDADMDLGTVSGTKLSEFHMRMTVSVRPRGAHQKIVRSSVMHNLRTVEDPEPYQAFFSALSKALFLEAHLVDDKSAGAGGKKITPVPKKMKLPGAAPKSTADPATASAAKPIGPSQKTPTLVSVPMKESVERVSLRKRPMELSSQMEATDMLLEYDFFDSSKNAYGTFVNDFVDNNDDTITDKATGLMWQRGGSSKPLDNRGAKKYIKQLNKKRFAGYADWRMPTLEELASLLVQRRKNGVHLAPVFDNKSSRCWTTDECDNQNYLTSGAWIVNFKQGQIQQGWYKKPSVTANFGITALSVKNGQNFVKAVRSVR